MKKTWVLGLAASSLALPFMPGASASVSTSTSLTVSAHVELDASWSCDNTGPTVNVGGILVLGSGPSVQFTFKNNDKGTHTYITPPIDVPWSVTVNGGDGITVPKQPAIAQSSGSWWGTGAGGNPYISFQAVDSNGNSLGNPILLGRCVQGTSFKHVSQDWSLSAGVDVTVTPTACTNDKSSLDFGGDGTHVGAKGLLYLDNNINKVVHRATTSADMGFDLDSSEVVPKSGHLDGAGGNPWISVQVLDAHGNVVSDTALGRCRQL
jgi:hypothetical protein